MLNHILSAFRTYMHGDGAVLLPEMQLLLFAIGTLAMDSWAANTSSEKPGGNPVFQQKYWNPADCVGRHSFQRFDAMDATSANYAVWRSCRFPSHAGGRQLLYIFLGTIPGRHCACDFAFGELLDDLSRSDQGRYYALLLFACMSMMLMVSAVDLMVIFLAVEAASISAYFLAATPGLSNRTPSAAVRFLFSSALGSAIVAYAFSLLYGLSGATNISQVAGALGAASQRSKGHRA